MTLEDLGYNSSFEKSRNELDLNAFDVGRVVAENKERYTVRTDIEEYEAEIIGTLRYTASSRSDFPAVGDWVAVSSYGDQKAVIHKILPRKSVLERQAVGKYGEKQVIAANIDYAFIIQAVDRDFNINRLERYLILCHTARVSPLIVLSKTDLINETEISRVLESVNERINSVPVLAVSNLTKTGYEKLLAMITYGKTYCFLGSSGAGKSTMINTISDTHQMNTGSISPSTNKGRHVTSHRELIVLDSGGILIDNPGMREVGIADTENGLEITYEAIISLSGNCRFRDCSHTHEKGCAVREAVDRGDIDKASYENYLKLEREKVHFQSSNAEKRQKDREFGKMVKKAKKNIKRDKQAPRY